MCEPEPWVEAEKYYSSFDARCETCKYYGNGVCELEEDGQYVYSDDEAVKDPDDYCDAYEWAGVEYPDWTEDGM